jgi:TfoX/Sxy family transcriptional regulator of competence genes
MQKLYVDSTLIVKGTSSSQEKAEISGKFFVYPFYF